MPKATPEDLIKTVIAADDLRRRARGFPSTRAALSLTLGRPSRERVFLEPFFNVLGLVWGQLMFFMPWAFLKRYTQWANKKLAGFPAPPNPELPQRIEEAIHLAHALKQKTGQWPAFLVLTSHPETEGPLQWLRFELLRQGLQIADAVVEAKTPGVLFRSHPRCLLAIDPFALDTVSPAVGGFYGAWMHRSYLAWDRQPSTQSWLQKRFLLRNTDYSRIVWRLIKFLKADVPVLMAISGGLPYNARLLYAVREFVQRLPIRRWTISKRQAQVELIQHLMTPEGEIWPADDGEIPPGKKQMILAALLRWGLPAEDVERAFSELREEFKRPVPYRARLFRVLFARLVARGKPLMVVGIHHTPTPPYVRISEPVEIARDAEASAITDSISMLFKVQAS